MALGFIVFSHVDGHAPPPMEPREGYQSVNAYLSSFTLLIYGFRVRDTQALVQRGRRPRRERAARERDRSRTRSPRVHLAGKGVCKGGIQRSMGLFLFRALGLGSFQAEGLGPDIGLLGFNLHGWDSGSTAVRASRF